MKLIENRMQTPQLKYIFCLVHLVHLILGYNLDYKGKVNTSFLHYSNMTSHRDVKFVLLY